MVQWLGVFHSIDCSISALKLYKDISKKMKPSNRVQKFLFDLVLLLFKVWPRSSDIVWPFWSQSVHSILNSYVPLKLIVPRNKYKVISSLKDPPLYKLQLMLTRLYPQKKKKNKKIVPRHRYKVNNPLKDPPLYIDIVLNYSFLIVSLYLTMNEIACRVYNMGNYHRASL